MAGLAPLQAPAELFLQSFRESMTLKNNLGYFSKLAASVVSQPLTICSCLPSRTVTWRI